MRTRTGQPVAGGGKQFIQGVTGFAKMGDTEGDLRQQPLGYGGVETGTKSRYRSKICIGADQETTVRPVAGQHKVGCPQSVGNPGNQFVTPQMRGKPRYNAIYRFAFRLAGNPPLDSNDRQRPMVPVALGKQLFAAQPVVIRRLRRF